MKVKESHFNLWDDNHLKGTIHNLCKTSDHVENIGAVDERGGTIGATMNGIKMQKLSER